MKKRCEFIVDCPEKKEVIFTKNGFEILECKICHHRFTLIKNPESHLSSIYSDSYFFEGKDGYPNYLEEKAILIKHGVRYAKIISKYIDNPGSMLDAGCAAGFILKGFEQHGWTCSGVEPNKTMVQYGIKELGLNIKVGNFESFETDDKFGLITLIQVIGHFLDIDKALKNANRLLRPRGLVLVESWDRNSIPAKLLGKHWHEYCPPSVIHWFSDKTLIDLFEFYGFKLIKKGLPLKQISLKHAISLLGNMIPNIVLKQRLIKFCFKILGKMSVIYPPIDVKWYIFQKVN